MPHKVPTQALQEQSCSPGMIKIVMTVKIVDKDNINDDGDNDNCTRIDDT